MSRTASEGLVVLKMPSALLGAEVRSVAARRALSAELLGTLLLTFFTAGVVIVTGGMLGEKLSSSRLLVTSMAHGLAFGLLVYTMAGMSAGHLNPVLTLGAMIMRQMTLTRGVMYLAAQLVGAVCGAVLLKLALPAGVPLVLGLPALGPRVTAEAALVVEGMLAFTLVVAFLASGGKGSAPVVVGLTTTLGRLFGMALTGAPMNPALVFGVALASGMWTGHWVWWVGPLLGSALAALCWHSWFSKGEKHSGDGRAWR
ncbi:MAG TPA: aquaporin [Methylomirabilota bacterium]|nr:aquaporin [Methylomirabilota bacterium]